MKNTTLVKNILYLSKYSIFDIFTHQTIIKNLLIKIIHKTKKHIKFTVNICVAVFFFFAKLPISLPKDYKPSLP